MKINFSAGIVSRTAIAIVCAIEIHCPQISSAQEPPSPATTENVQSPATVLPPTIPPSSPLAQIVKLTQAGVDESVLISYVNNSAEPFRLTPDQIIYLKDIGLPDTVVQAMIQRDQQLGVTDDTQATAATTETPPPTGEVNDTYFYDALTPYGNWVNIEGCGLCWQPTVVIYTSDWQPYCNRGHWIYTDDGWFWASDYSWGWATFHYGRWFHDARWGWCWWPDTTWAPSWVCWRYSNDYCGWAPLPPHTGYREGVGIVFNGAVVQAGFDFGISANFFTFVPTKNFCDHRLSRYRVERSRAPVIYRQTTVINNFGVQNHIIVNHGIDPRHITAVTHAPIHPVVIREATTPVAHGEELGRDQTLIVNRPHFNGSAISTMHQGVAPRHETQNRNAPQNYQPQLIKSPAERENQRNVPQNGNVTPAHNSQTGAPVQTSPAEQREIHNTPATSSTPENHFRQNETPTPNQNYDHGNSSHSQHYMSPHAAASQPQQHNAPPVQQTPSGSQQQRQSQNGDKDKNDH